MKFETSIFYDEREYLFKVKSRSDDNGALNYELKRSKLSNGKDYDLLQFVLAAFNEPNLLPAKQNCKYANFKDIINFLLDGNSIKIQADTNAKKTIIQFFNIFEADKTFVYSYQTGSRGQAIVRAFEAFGVDYKRKLIEEFEQFE
ncbi:MAG: hypothetical protein ACOX6H_03665 [Christensenellales bacterium]|jgi:hypothetical protein